VIERFNLRSFGRLRFDDLHRASFTNLLSCLSGSLKSIYEDRACRHHARRVLRQSLGCTLQGSFIPFALTKTERLAPAMRAHRSRNAMRPKKRMPPR
jgi:hypothetical protein